LKLQILIFSLFGFCAKSLAQNIDSAMLQRLATKDALPYKEENGQYMGCGYTTECRPMHTIFYQAP
jgi:hypothetical protein